MTGGLVSSQSQSSEEQMRVAGLWSLQYQVADVARAVDFYTQCLGFNLDQQNPPASGQVSRGHVKLILTSSDPSSSPSIQDAQTQNQSASNRLVLHVEGLASQVEKMKQAGVRFRNQIDVGNSGKQIQLEDPDGNLIDLFEPSTAEGHARPAMSAVESLRQFVSEWLLPVIISVGLIAMIFVTAAILLR